MNSAYRWDATEGTVGVLGVAPRATLDFCRRLAALVPARKDWEHVRVLVDMNPKIPSRGRHLDLGEADPSPHLRRGIEGLLERGATVVAVPCNTAHIFYERYATGLAAQVPDMVEVAIDAARRRLGTVPSRVAVLGTRHTVAHDRYGRQLRARGGAAMDVGQWQAVISAVIEAVKQGRDLGEQAARLGSVLAEVEHAGADAMVIACTELSAVALADGAGCPIIDASDTLARHCLRAVGAANENEWAGTS